MLYGRDAECRVVEDLLEGARRGRSGALVLRGEAGIGKTALLRYAAEQARGDRVLQVRAVQAESGLPFAGLHALVYPVREYVQSLSGPQREALGSALGLSGGGAPSRFLVAAGVLELLATLAEERPVLCLVDDVQWMDPQSLGALTFVQRRLQGDRVALLFALRTGALGRGGSAARLLGDLPQRSVEALDDSACERLLEQRKELDRSARMAVKAAARGNPLALTVLPATTLADQQDLPALLSERVEADYLSQVEDLDRTVRHLLLLAAADDTGDLAVLLRAAGPTGAGTTDLESAEERGLLRIAGRTVGFTHPLVRSAVYGSAPSTARRAAHLALAAAMESSDPTRATWHRAAAAVAPSEPVAAALGELARAAVHRADTALAARAFTRAAELTGDPRRRVTWLLDAAEACWESGHGEQAGHLVTRARSLAAPEADPGRLDQLRGRLEAWTGSTLQGYEILLEGAERILQVAPARAASMLFDALRAAAVSGDMDRVVRAGRTAAHLVTSAGNPPSAAFAAGIAELLTGGGAGAVATLRAGIDTLGDTGDPVLLSMAAIAAAYTGDAHLTELLAARSVAQCRQTGALGTLAQALEALTVAQLDGAPARAEASADEGLRAARETDQVASAAAHLATLATVAAARGDRGATEDFADQVSQLDRVHGLGYAAARAVAARGLLELGLGRPQEALVHYEALAAGGAHRAAQLSAADFTMLAAVWAGRRERARDLLATVGSWAWLREADPPWAQATLDRWQALLADGDTATALYERSLDRQAGSPRSFLLALTHLLLGEHLRRGRHRASARPHLRLAMQIFQRLDAVPWAARARTELRATGETVRRHDESPRLTPQELQVAQLVATGASTKKVAAQLYLSPRTVDSHLRQIFTKLGISSRAEIRDVDLTG